MYDFKNRSKILNVTEKGKSQPDYYQVLPVVPPR